MPVFRRAAIVAAILATASALADPSPAALVDGKLSLGAPKAGITSELVVKGPKGFSVAQPLVAGAWTPPANAPDGVYDYQIVRLDKAGRKVTFAGGFLVENGRISMHAEQPVRH